MARGAWKRFARSRLAGGVAALGLPGWWLADRAMNTESLVFVGMLCMLASWWHLDQLDRQGHPMPAPRPSQGELPEG